MIRGFLRSPLHRLLSGQLLLLGYTGRVSGRRYSIPIGYFAWDEGSILSFSGSRWWTNLHDSQPVSLTIKGVRQKAAPTVVDSLDARVELLGEFVLRYGPTFTGRLRMGLPSDRHPTPDELRMAAVKKMLIRFEPAGPEPLVGAS